MTHSLRAPFYRMLVFMSVIMLRIVAIATSTNMTVV